MELEELKNYLNRQLEEQSTLQSSGEISAILRNKSIGIVHRIRKNLWIELLNYVNNIKRKVDSKLWLPTVDLSLIIQVLLL